MLSSLKSSIQDLLQKAERPADAVTLMAVSKTRSIDEVRKAYDENILHFGENYVQEGLAKIAEAKRQELDIIWHLIGPLQKNKAKKVANEFDWVDAIDSIAIAQKLNQHRSEEKPPLNICLQVNIDRASSKSGFPPEFDALMEVCSEIERLPNLSLRGIMVIPDAGDEKEVARHFEAAEALFQNIKKNLPEVCRNSFDVLSMGMSHGFKLAIAAGASMIRIGSAIFGPRK